MGDFFTRLAERALGLAPVVQPDLPSIFAPAAPLELSMETSPTRESERAKLPAADAAPAALKEKARPQMQPVPPIHRTFHDRKIAPPLVNVRKGKGDSAHAKDPFAAEDRAVKPVSGPVSDEAADRGLVRMSTDEADSPVLGRERTLIKPARSVILDSATFPVANVDTTAPAIQVSIGRVEVRAVTLPAPPSRAVERKAPPLLSLDQYLQQRNERRR